MGQYCQRVHIFQVGNRLSNFLLKENVYLGVGLSHITDYFSHIACQRISVACLTWKTWKKLPLENKYFKSKLCVSMKNKYGFQNSCMGFSFYQLKLKKKKRICQSTVWNNSFKMSFQKGNFSWDVQLNKHYQLILYRKSKLSS